MKLINRIGIAVVIFSSLAIAVPTAIAHHSGVEFDTTKVVELSGTIKEFQFKNPHTWIQVMVPNPKGEPVEWSLE